MDEQTSLYWSAIVMIVSGLGTAIALLIGFKASYGRYAEQANVNIVIPRRLDWFIQELPSFGFGFYYLWQCEHFESFLMLVLFVIHYTNRTFIYPLQLKAGNGTPWFISLSAISFTTWNGYTQGAWHAKYADINGFWSFLTLIGYLTFATGMYINIQSDSILRNLRKPGETGYKIPRGGMFDYISGANYFGEIVEWAGYAMVCKSLPAFAFWVFTCSNIGPRALQHHEDYKLKFKDYPPERRALIPFVL